MAMIPRAVWHYVAALYFAVEALCCALWWLVLWVEPGARLWFRPVGTPDSALLSFALPDAVVFIGAGVWAAWWLFKDPQRARGPLALHLGGVGYAALYCVGQTVLTGEARAGAISMTLCALCGGFLGWKAVFSGD